MFITPGHPSILKSEAGALNSRKADLAPALFPSISEEERDILSYVRTSPKGVPASVLNQPQFDSLAALVGGFVRRLPDEVAGAQLHDLERMGMDSLTFAWAGGTEPGDRHYYRVQGPTLLIEHDNTQGNGTHIHSAWRNPADDFGDDVLAEHYRTHHT